MSEVFNIAVEYIEEAKISWLITVGDNKTPYIRPIGAFASTGVDLYFLTSRGTAKVKQISENRIVTFYFEEPGQQSEKFKSVAVSGEASEVLEDEELKNAIEAISVRYPAIKEKVSNGEIKASAIYKVNAKFIKVADYTKSPREITENV